MTTDASDRLLRTTLLANSVFSLISGSVMFIADGLVAALLGTFEAVWLVSLVGLGVVLFGAFVLWLARRETIPENLAWLVIGADLTWVIGSWAMILGTGWLSGQGAWAVGIVAEIVGVFAILQWLGVRRVAAAQPA